MTVSADIYVREWHRGSSSSSWFILSSAVVISQGFSSSLNISKSSLCGEKCIVAPESHNQYQYSGRIWPWLPRLNIFHLGHSLYCKLSFFPFTLPLLLELWVFNPATLLFMTSSPTSAAFPVFYLQLYFGISFLFQFYFRDLCGFYTQLYWKLVIIIKYRIEDFLDIHIIGIFIRMEKALTFRKWEQLSITSKIHVISKTTLISLEIVF